MFWAGGSIGAPCQQRCMLMHAALACPPRAASLLPSPTARAAGSTSCRRPSKRSAGASAASTAPWPVPRVRRCALRRCAAPLAAGWRACRLLVRTHPHPHPSARPPAPARLPAEREARVRQFQGTPNIPLFLLTSQVGGLGLTLTAADRVVILDPAWNPSTGGRAQGRAAARAHAPPGSCCQARCQARCPTPHTQAAPLPVSPLTHPHLCTQTTRVWTGRTASGRSGTWW